MSLSNMQTTLNTVVMPLVVELLSQRMEAFNGASDGSIRLSTDAFAGDFMQEAFFADISSAVRRVDRYAANAAVAPTDLTQQKISSVKIAGGVGPIVYEPSQMTWLSRPTSDGIAAASRAFAEMILRDQLNTAIAALVASISNQASAAATSAALSYVDINTAHAKFGDRSTDIVANVMTGAAYHTLIGANLMNVERLFTAQGVTVVDVLGKRTVITDAPALMAASKQRVLCLTRSAATIFDGNDVVDNLETSNGKGRIESSLQLDYTFGLSLKGYSWDEVAGGHSPTNEKLATGTNWVKKATDIKQTAGTILIAG